MRQPWRGKSAVAVQRKCAGNVTRDAQARAVPRASGKRVRSEAENAAVCHAVTDMLMMFSMLAVKI